MRALNRVELIGRLGADPDSRTTQNGDAVAKFNIATNESWTDKQTGEQKEATEWHRCVLWRKLAEIASKYLKKGTRVYVAGQLKTRKWEDDTGQVRYITEIQVRDLIMLDSQDTTQGRQQSQSAPPEGEPPFDDDIPF